MRARSSRIDALRSELQGLDNEIEDINEFLNESSESYDEISQSYEESPVKNRSFTGKNHENRLYRESLEILERRTHQVDSFDDENSTLFIQKKPFKLKNYRPPSERIEESRIKRSQSVKRYKEQNEREFREECTFRPKINRRRNIEEHYDPEHLLRPTPRRRAEIRGVSIQETPHRRMINKKSEAIAESIEMKKGDDFYTRQLRPKRSKSVCRADNMYNTKRKTITKEEEREMIEHLTQPKKRVYEDNIEPETPKKKIISNPSVFEHLVSQSLRKEVPIPDEPAIKPVMNARSRKLTENKEVNLFEQSLASKMKRERVAEEQKNWEEMQKLNECTFKPKIIHRRRKETRKPKVAGMEDYVERMRKVNVETDDNEIKPIPKVKRGAILQRPFSFERRVQKKQVTDEKAVDEVLSEINQLLAFV